MISGALVASGSSLTITARVEKDRVIKPGTLQLERPDGAKVDLPNVAIQFDPDTDARTFFIRLRGSDLAAFLARQIPREEALKRIEVRVF